MIGSIGSVSDASVVFSNKVPYVEIEYPVPLILNHREQHETVKTYTDVPTQGLNFYEEIVNIQCIANAKGERPSKEEMEELITILKGGVILNVYSS